MLSDLNVYQRKMRVNKFSTEYTQIQIIKSIIESKNRTFQIQPNKSFQKTKLSTKKRERCDK